jgi:hypothetical protein
VGGYGGQLCHLQVDGGSTTYALPLSGGLSAVFSLAGDVFAGGDNGVIYHLDGGAEQTGGTDGIQSIHGTDLAHLWAVDSAGQVHRRMPDAGWPVVYQSHDTMLSDVWALGADDVWAGGYPVGGLHHFDGGSWKAVAQPFGLSGFRPFGVRGSSTKILLYGETFVDSDGGNSGIVKLLVPMGQ